MTKSFNVKAQSAFKKLGAVALITATICFNACNQTGGGGGKPTPRLKHVITFSVDSTTPNGTLKAKADGIPETEASPITVEEGKTVTFTAKANDGYRVKGWTLDGSPVAKAGTNTEYKLKVIYPVTVSVSFESNSTPPTPQTKYTVTLTQTGGGKVTASPAIPADGQVAKDTEITFTATANAGYRVGTWVITPSEAIQSGGGEGNETAKVKITADTSVSVSFTKKTYAVTFIVAGTGGKLTAQADGVAETETSPIDVEHGKTVTFTAKADTGYKVKEWKVDGNVVAGNTSDSYTHTITKAVNVKVSFTTHFAVLTLSPDKLTIKVRAKTVDGSAIAVEGCTETTLKNDRYTYLYANETTVTLKGNITELICWGNQLTALNVQGLTALQRLSCDNNKLTALNIQDCSALKYLGCYVNQLTSLNVQGLNDLKYLYCWGNKLTVEAFIKIFTDLPTCVAGDKAECYLYTEKTDEDEGNCTDFTQPESLKKAFEEAKAKHWKLQKLNGAFFIPSDI